MGTKSCRKKRKTTSQSQSDWSALHSDLLDTILRRLSFPDKLVFKDICSWWHSVAKSHIKSFLIELKSESPLLLMPTDPEEGNNYKEDNCLLNIVKKVQKPFNMPAKSHCIGSSKGWLILVQDKVNLLIYNPLLDVEFHLPRIDSFPQFNYDPVYLSEHWISKAIMWGDPILGHNYGVAVIYGCDSKIAYANREDREWTRFEYSDKDYIDIIVCQNFIYALSGTGSVEAWYSNRDNPTRAMDLKLSFPKNIVEFKEPTRELYSNQFYIVESKGDLLLVIRCIGDFVNPDGEPILEQDLYEGYCFPYMTKNFYVYKLEKNNREWTELKDLGDQTVFVGGNESKSLSAKDYEGCKENTIYYSDDCWDRMDEDYMYGGHDMGVFDLGDRSIKEIYDCNLDYRMTPAFWIIQK